MWNKKTDSGINFNCLLTAWLYGIYNFRHFFPHLLFRKRETNFLPQFEEIVEEFDLLLYIDKKIINAYQSS